MTSIADLFKFRKLKWQDYFHSYVTPREWKKGARDIPFGQGAKSLYVDGVNGNDHNDGQSWKTAFKTIQTSVDNAERWSSFYIKDAIYAENVIVNKESLRFYGESRSGVIIKPSSGVALTINAEDCSVCFLTTYTNDVGDYSFKINADSCHVDSVCLDSVADAHGIRVDADFCNLTHLYSVGPNLNFAVAFHPGHVFSTVNSSFFNLTNSLSAPIRLASNTENVVISENIFKGGQWGVYALSGAQNNAIFHNNFFSVNEPIVGVDCHFFENYYSNHSNIDNGFGIATEPYKPAFAIDLRPVACPDGWNSISIQRALLRKKTGKQATAAAVDANGTSWVDLKSITPTTSDLELYRIQMTVAGTWAGTAKYRIIVGSDKVYPFSADKNISSGTLETFVFPINVQINETVKVQIRSDNAGDGAGDTVTLDQLDYSEVL